MTEESAIAPMTRNSCENEPLYAIERYERESSAFWLVEFMRNRKLITSCFSDKKHGGREQALAAALAFRDKALRENPPTSKLELRQRKRKGLPGMAGVYRYVKVQRGGKKTLYWEARTRMPDGKYRIRCFNADRLGEERARQLAEQERLKQLAETEDAPHLTTELSRRTHAQLFGSTQ